MWREGGGERDIGEREEEGRRGERYNEEGGGRVEGREIQGRGTKKRTGRGTRREGGR